MSNKKYYWLKLKADFFDDDTISYIEEQENGILYSNFYLKLCLKSLKDDGHLIRLVGDTLIPYDAKSLSKLTGVDVDTVKVAMNLFQKIGLIQILETGEIFLTQINEMIGSETSQAAIMRRKRAEKKALEQSEGNIVTEMLPSVTEMLHRDRDRVRERDKEIEIEKEIEIDNNAPSVERSEPPIIELPLNDKTMYPIYQEQIEEWNELYQSVNIVQELKKMKGWLNANPTKRKTKRGINRFINGWLAREQDRYHAPMPKAEKVTSNPFMEVLIEGDDL